MPVANNPIIVRKRRQLQALWSIRRKTAKQD